MDKRMAKNLFRERLADIDKYHEDYSPRVAELVGKSKIHILNGIDDYWAATRHVSEWSLLMAPLLETFVKLYEGHSASKAKTQNRLLQKMLNNGVTKLNLTNTSVNKMSINFVEALQTLYTLSGILKKELDWDNGSKALHSGATVKDLKRDLVEFRQQVEDVIKYEANELLVMSDMLSRHFEHLKAESENLTNFDAIGNVAEIYDELVKAPRTLIEKCNKYAKKHEAFSV